MGMFDWLARKKEEPRVKIDSHRIWLSQEAKCAGIRAAAAQALSDPAGPTAILVVAHFNDCLGQLYAAVADLDSSRILVVRADALPRQTIAELAGDPSNSILILVGERHPLPSHDQAITDFAETLPCRCRIASHVSLDDALIKRFAGGWVEQVLRRLGMKEDEAIESQNVNRRIQREMKTIAERAKGDGPAESAQEWLEQHCP
jgi:hypothetical protein